MFGDGTDALYGAFVLRPGENLHSLRKDISMLSWDLERHLVAPSASLSLRRRRRRLLRTNAEMSASYQCSYSIPIQFPFRATLRLSAETACPNQQMTKIEENCGKVIVILHRSTSEALTDVNLTRSNCRYSVEMQQSSTFTYIVQNNRKINEPSIVQSTASFLFFVMSFARRVANGIIKRRCKLVGFL